MIVSLEHRVNPGKSMPDANNTEIQYTSGVDLMPSSEEYNLPDLSKPKGRKPGTVRRAAWPHINLNPGRIALAALGLLSLGYSIFIHNHGSQQDETPAIPQTASDPANLPTPNSKLSNSNDPRDQAPKSPSSETRDKLITGWNKPTQTPTPNPTSEPFDPLRRAGELATSVNKAISLPLSNPTIQESSTKPVETLTPPKH